MEKLTKENECQRQDINHLQYTKKTLEEHKKTIKQNNEKNDQTRIKEKGGKNDQNKGMKMSKKKIGINSKLIFKCTAQENVKYKFRYNIYF